MTDDQRLKNFGVRMRELRAHAGYLTGKDFAERLGWHPSKVSRIENGRQAPSDSDVNEWFAATATSESVASELHNELRSIRIDMAAWPRQLKKGHTERQQQAAAIERRSSVIRAFDLVLLPGLVQTAAYAWEILRRHARMHNKAADDIGGAVQARMDRQRVLFDTAKRIEILILEPALLYAYGSPQIMMAQIDRLLAIADLSTVRFGIVPLMTELPSLPLNGIWIFDDSVIVETNDSEIVEDDPADLAFYNKVLDDLWTVAAQGAQARAILLEAGERWASKDQQAAGATESRQPGEVRR